VSYLDRMNDMPAALWGVGPRASSSPTRAHVLDQPHTQPSTALDQLTDREREIVILVAHGLSNEDIADRLHLSPLTAKTHVNRAMTKLAARDRAQLVVIAYQNGLVRPGDTLP
jgi:DNA-binding NarL/FixJ family response regulator